MCKIMIATGLMVGGAYGIEIFTAWYSGNAGEWFTFKNRVLGEYAWAYMAMVSCNVIVPQFFWFKKCRTNPWIVVGLCILINVGMWFERFVIIATSLARQQIPGMWGYFSPTRWDVLTMIGSFGLFFTMFLLFVRFLPVIAIAEVKAVTPEAHAGKDDH
jgi:molybdopterin-containing oxidoreductase family membrane subunit